MIEPPRVTKRPTAVSATTAYWQLLYGDLSFFMSQLRDPAGQLLIVADHHRRWCRLVTEEPRLVLLGPRDHSKSTVALVDVLWRCWRHGRDAATGRLKAGSLGKYMAAVFSATREQAAVFSARFRDLLVANEWLFGEVGPGATAADHRLQRSWSATRVRLASGAELRVRVYRTSTRGLHPDLLVLDDVLSDQNSLSQDQRDRTWRYFIGTLLPMHAPLVLILGTAFHHDDLLFRLAPRMLRGGVPPGSTPSPEPVLGFAWRRFRALDEPTGTALWPTRHAPQELIRLRDFDPVTFSREYQNVPRDDIATMFPFELTERALAAGRDLTLVPSYRPAPGEVVLLGVDLAISEAAGADYSVAIVVAYNRATGCRRVLTIRRQRGLDLAAQITLIGGLCRDYGVAVGVIEQNNFQRWLVDELQKRPETRGRIFGHTTGQEKTSLTDGVPMLKLRLLDGLWVMPCGDAESRQLARAWQAELAAFGWQGNRLQGVGENDDLVIASWFVELAAKLVDHLLARPPAVTYVTGQDLGIERVRISPDLDAADRGLRTRDDAAWDLERSLDLDGY